MSSPRRRAKHIWEPIYWILIWCVIREHHGFVSVGLSVCVGRHGKTRTQIHVDIIPRVKHLKGFSPLCFQYGPIYSVNDFWRYSTKWIDPYSNKKENEENLLNVTRSYVQMLFVYAKWVVGPHLCADMMCVHFSQKKIRSTTQTHRRLLSTLERVRSPSAVRFIGIGFLFRNSLCVLSSSSVGWVLESILFHSSFSLFFFFNVHCSRFGVHIYFAYTHLAYYYFWPRFESASGKGCWCSGVVLLFYDMEKKFKCTREKQTERRGEEIGTNELDGLCESFFPFGAFHFFCLCLESEAGYEVCSVAFLLFSNSVEEKKTNTKIEAKNGEEKLHFHPEKFLLLIENRNVKILQTICNRVSFIDTDNVHAPAAYCFVLNSWTLKNLSGTDSRNRSRKGNG